MARSSKHQYFQDTSQQHSLCSKRSPLTRRPRLCPFVGCEQQQRRITRDGTFRDGHVNNLLRIPTEMIDRRERKIGLRLLV